LLSSTDHLIFMIEVVYTVVSQFWVQNPRAPALSPKQKNIKTFRNDKMDSVITLFTLLLCLRLMFLLLVAVKLIITVTQVATSSHL
jgi:hypothetical protein